MAAAVNNVQRQQSLLVFDRQNLNRLSTQRGLTQLPLSRCLSALHKNAVCALLPRASAELPQSKG